MGFKTSTGILHPGFVSGRYYSMLDGGASANFLMVENTLYYIPFFCPKAQLFDRFGFHITTGAGHANNEVRTGIYGTRAGVPGNLVLDNGRTVIGTGTGNTNITISHTLAAGWHWLVMISNRAPGGSATQPTIRGVTTETARGPWHYFVGSANVDMSGTGLSHYRHAETVPDWTTYTLPNPADTPTLQEAATTLSPWLRAA